MKSNYINTDLDIKSSDDLSHLVDILNEKCDLLYGQKEEDGHWFIRVEASNSGCVGSDEHHPNRDIDQLLQVIEGLSTETKALLQRANQFDFDIGWQAGEKRPEGRFTLANELLRRISDIGATVSVTIYPSESDSAP